MAQNQLNFSNEFAQAQNLASNLELAVASLEHSLAASRSNRVNPSPYDGDLEEQGRHPFLVELESVSALHQRLLLSLQRAQDCARTAHDRSRLNSLARIADDAAVAIPRYRHRFMDAQRKADVERYLFSGLSSTDDNNSVMSASDEHDKLSSSLRAIGSSISHAMHSLDSIERQNELMRSIQHKTAEMAQSLGVSRNVIGWIERQENTNTVIAILGMVMISIIIIVFYYWLKH